MEHPKTLKYYGTEEPLLPGDRIIVDRLFRSGQLGTVVYVPGISPLDNSVGDDQWAYKLDDGSIYAAGFSPSQVSVLSKKIRLIHHAADEAKDTVDSYRIPPEKEQPETLRDFLALLGCGVLILLIGVVGYVLVKWFF